MTTLKLVAKYAELKAKEKAIKEELSTIGNLVMDAMHKDDLLTVKTKNATVTVAKRITPQVDEVVFRNWLDEQPSLERDMFFKETLDKSKAVDYAEKVLHEDGEKVPYITGVQETEYLSVTKAKVKND